MAEIAVTQSYRPRKRSLRVSYLLPATVAAALVSSGCVAPPTTTTATTPTTTTPTTTDVDPEPTDVAVCVDPETNVRVDDELCDTDDDTYSRFWLHHSPSLIYPAVGAVVGLALGTFLRPTTGRILDSGVPATGGRVLRGGFGGHHSAGS